MQEEQNKSCLALQHRDSLLGYTQKKKKAEQALSHWELQKIPNFSEALACATIWWQPYAASASPNWA